MKVLRRELMANDDVPDYIREYIIKSSQFMEGQVKLLEKIEVGMSKRDQDNLVNQQRWQTVIETMNQNLVSHNTNVEGKFEDVCKAMGSLTEESKLFRTDTWEWAKGLITKIVIVALVIIGTVLGITNIPGI
jgi:hypothetical protein